MNTEQRAKIAEAARVFSNALASWEAVEECGVHLRLGLKLAAEDFRKRHALAPLTTEQQEARAALNCLAEELSMLYDLEEK